MLTDNALNGNPATQTIGLTGQTELLGPAGSTAALRNFCSRKSTARALGKWKVFARYGTICRLASADLFGRHFDVLTRKRPTCRKPRRTDSHSGESGTATPYFNAYAREPWIC